MLRLTVVKPLMVFCVPPGNTKFTVPPAAREPAPVEAHQGARAAVVERRHRGRARVDHQSAVKGLARSAREVAVLHESAPAHVERHVVRRVRVRPHVPVAHLEDPPLTVTAIEPCCVLAMISVPLSSVRLTTRPLA